MADTTSIEWTDTTWNPVTVCTKISGGCDRCRALFCPALSGGRSGRGAHRALATLNEAIAGGMIGCVLEADLKNFFGSLDHEWVLRFVEHRGGDPRVINLIRRWLKTGVLEDGQSTQAMRELRKGIDQRAVEQPGLEETRCRDRSAGDIGLCRNAIDQVASGRRSRSLSSVIG